jgi:hypothetical protein
MEVHEVHLHSGCRVVKVDSQYSQLEQAIILMYERPDDFTREYIVSELRKVPKIDIPIFMPLYVCNRLVQEYSKPEPDSTAFAYNTYNKMLLEATYNAKPCANWNTRFWRNAPWLFKGKVKKWNDEL